MQVSRKRKSNKKNIFKDKKTLIAICASVLLLALAFVWAYFWAPQREKISYPIAYEEEIRSAAREFSVHPCLLAGLIYCESSFRVDAVSGVGAVGLTQIMPDTGQWLAGKLNIEDYSQEMLLDPGINIRMGGWYLSYLIQRYDGQLQEALTAYIAGQGQVDKWLDDPELSSDGKTLSTIPGRDVKEYAAKVVRMYEIYLEIYGDLLDPDHEFDGLLQ